MTNIDRYGIFKTKVVRGEVSLNHKGKREEVYEIKKVLYDFDPTQS